MSSDQNMKNYFLSGSLFGEIRNYRLFKLTAFNLMSFLGLLQIITALLFLADVSISKFHFPLIFIGSLFFSYLISKDDRINQFRIEFIYSVILMIFLITFSIMISMYFYDFSWDGQAYHQETIIQLKDHWNPTKKYLSFTIIMSEVCNYYSKGIETLQATVYAFTNKIETGKATNFIFFFTAFFSCYSFLIERPNLSSIKALWIGILVVCNPVFICQAFTYYIDAHIYFLYVIMIIAAINIFMGEKKPSLIIYGFSVVLLLASKFIAIPITGILIISLLIILGLYRKYQLFFKVLTISVFFSFIGLLIVGYQPYVTNTINHDSPFFPFAGRGVAQSAPLVDQSPQYFPDKNRIEKLFISIFSHTENIQHAETSRSPELKIPFTIRKSELKIVWDQRIGAFGPFYSGAFVLSVILLILLLIKLEPKYKLYLISIMLALICSVIIISEAWWFRYVPQLWLFAIVIIIFTEKKWKNTFSGIILLIIYCALALNIILISAETLLWNYHVTKSVNEQLSYLQQSKKTVVANFSIFTSNRIRLLEHSIPYIQTTGPIDDSVSFSMPYSIVKMRYLSE